MGSLPATITDKITLGRNENMPDMHGAVLGCQHRVGETRRQ